MIDVSFYKTIVCSIYLRFYSLPLSYEFFFLSNKLKYTHGQDDYDHQTDQQKIYQFKGELTVRWEKNLNNLSNTRNLRKNQRNSVELC